MNPVYRVRWTVDTERFVEIDERRPGALSNCGQQKIEPLDQFGIETSCTGERTFEIDSRDAGDDHLGRDRRERLQKIGIRRAETLLRLFRRVARGIVGAEHTTAADVLRRSRENAILCIWLIFAPPMPALTTEWPQIELGRSAASVMLSPKNTTGLSDRAR
jgi:hypothetical protein